MGIQALQISLPAIVIGHIVLNVSDLARSEEFYDKLLFSLRYSSEHKEETDDYSVKVYHPGEGNGPDFWLKCEKTWAHQPFVRNIGLDHLAFRAASKLEVDRIFAELERAGTTITRTPSKYPDYSPEYYAFYFRDPDGIPLEVAYY